MMKKAIAIFAAACALLLFAACSGAQTEKNGAIGTQAETDKTVAADNVVIFNGDTIKLTYETNHRDLYYKQNIVSMNAETVGSFCNVSYRQDGDVAFEIRLVYYVNKSIDEVMGESDYTLSEKTVNGLTYTYFEYDDNGRPGHTYVYCYDGTSYTISFTSPYDMTSLETVFLNNIRFAKE